MKKKLLVATAVLLGSCARDAQPDGAVDEAASSVEAEASKAGQADAPAARTPPETPVLTAQGWGPRRIGMSLAEVTAAAGPDSDPAAVGGPEPETCDIFHPARTPEGLRVMIEDGRLSRVSLTGEAQLKTDKGVGLGDSVAAVKAAYAGAIVSSPHKYLHPLGAYLTAWTPASREVDVRDPAARGIRYEIGEGGRVASIHAGGPSIQYVEGCL